MKTSLFKSKSAMKCIVEIIRKLVVVFLPVNLIHGVGDPLHRLLVEHLALKPLPRGVCLSLQVCQARKLFLFSYN